MYILSIYIYVCVFYHYISLHYVQYESLKPPHRFEPPSRKFCKNCKITDSTLPPAVAEARQWYLQHQRCTESLQTWLRNWCSMIIEWKLQGDAPWPLGQDVRKLSSWCFPTDFFISPYCTSSNWYSIRIIYNGNLIQPSDLMTARISSSLVQL